MKQTLEESANEYMETLPVKAAIKCGCMVDITSSKGENVYVYTDNKGNKSAECPNCI